MMTNNGNSYQTSHLPEMNKKTIINNDKNNKLGKISANIFCSEQFILYWRKMRNTNRNATYLLITGNAVTMTNINNKKNHSYLILIESL